MELNWKSPKVKKWVYKVVWRKNRKGISTNSTGQPVKHLKKWCVSRTSALSTCYARLPSCVPSSFTEPRCSSFCFPWLSFTFACLTDLRIILSLTNRPGSGPGLCSFLLEGWDACSELLRWSSVVGQDVWGSPGPRSWVQLTHWTTAPTLERQHLFKW